MEEFDVLIVGAGISGISAAYHLQRDCPGKSFAILEGREAIGGTWDLFRYPGVRSDSDMFTLGYGFRPWREARAIADGPSIRAYVRDTAHEYGIEQHIRFGHRVKRAAWSSDEARWIVEAEQGGETRRFRVRFLMMCAGYYRYDQGYAPEFAGSETFKGQIVHPQHWPETLDYAGKRVVVIGSGATALSLVPAMAETAAHVTMLQRSPSYVFSLFSVDPVAKAVRKVLPQGASFGFMRAFRMYLSQIFFRLARGRPQHMRKRLLDLVGQQLDPAYVAAHFTPNYLPWEQRLCFVPDNDVFNAIRAGKAGVVTDHIERFDQTGVVLKSGKHLDADIIVSATGLNLQMFGGAELSVDGKRVESGKLHTYKGAMYSDVPNFMSVFGYVNASWTLRADLLSVYLCRVLNFLDLWKYDSVTPRLRAPFEDKELIDFSSGYFARSASDMPRQTTRAPWIQSQSYMQDVRLLRFGSIDDGHLEFAKAKAKAKANESAPLAHVS